SYGAIMEVRSPLQELDDAVSRGSAESRLRALWHTTDLLIAGTYTEDQIWTFGEVIERLASEIEVAARTQLAKRLARIDNAPIKIINKLAFDDSIDVAGPILRYSERLDVRTLVDNVRAKSQSHLLAISKRNSIAIPVTDELVARGNQKVVSSVAANKGARFSNFGFLHMIKRSESDSILAEQLGLRKDIPRHLFQQLIAKASDDVKKKLARERPDIASQILSSVTDVTGALHSKFGPASKNYFTAKRVVARKHQYGNLAENSILEYARSRKVEETTVGLSLLCSLPVDVVERALIENNREMTLILAKALDFSWETSMSLLFLHAKDHRIAARDLDGMREEFIRLNTQTCRSVLEFYRSRKNAAAADCEDRRLPQLHT
ncbi:MAG TPA: DUF2336 domain-containing protein, partial [Chthoniobacterales bacterium]